jgi:predicted transcriptional regulator
MTDHADVLISVRPEHATRIFSGVKTVELRKRRPNIEPGTSVWIYATAPIAALRGYAQLERIISDTPSAIWNKFGASTGVPKSEFENYFQNRKLAHALILGQIKILKRPILLDNMRKMVEGFHPPQFFCRLNGAVAGMRLHSRKFNEIKSYVARS